MQMVTVNTKKNMMSYGVRLCLNQAVPQVCKANLYV